MAHRNNMRYISTNVSVNRSARRNATLIAFICAAFFFGVGVSRQQGVVDLTEDQIQRLRAPGGYYRSVAGVATAGPGTGNGAENGAGNGTDNGVKNDVGTGAGNCSGNGTGNGTVNESSTGVGSGAGNGCGSGGENGTGNDSKNVVGNGAGNGAGNGVGNGAAPELVRVEFKVDPRFIADNDVVLTTYELLRTKTTIFRKVCVCVFFVV